MADSPSDGEIEDLANDLVQDPDFTDDPARRAACHDALQRKFGRPPEVFEPAFLKAVGDAPAFFADGVEPALPEAIDGYKVLKELGHGGNGIVYLVEKGDRRFALKTVHAGTARGPIDNARFTKEFSKLMALENLWPGVCRVETRGFSAGGAYLVMEYVEGESLAALAIPESQEAVRERIETIISVAGVLHQVHLKEVIHRDIKPGNIIRRPDGQATIVDFGIARDVFHSGMTTSRDRYQGTPDYKSPEQKRGDVIDEPKRSDLWSLAATLHWILFRKLPYAAGASVVITPAALPGFDQVSCDRLRRILQDALAEVPDLRYPTAAEFAEELRRLLAGEDPAGPSQRLAAYRRHLQDSHRSLLPFFPGASDYLLDQVCVDVAVEESSARGDRDATPEEVRQAEAFERLPPRGGRRLLAEFLADELPDTQRGGRAPRLLLLGEPGSGKTTMERRLVGRQAAKESGPIPIFIPLSLFSEALLHPFVLAERQFRKARELEGRIPPPPLKPAFESLRTKRRGLWLFLDALDEVPPEKMEVVRKQILKWDEELKNVALIVSSRFVAAAAFPKHWDTLKVQPLERPEQDRLLGNLLGPEAARSLREDLEPRPPLKEMARNPLLLTMIAFVAREATARGRRLPLRRVRLFKKVIRLLLKRGYGPEPGGMKDTVLARRMLRRLSLHLQREGGEAWRKRKLYYTLWAVGRKSLSGRVIATWGSYDKFLEDCGTNSGIIGPHDGAGLPWRYLHRTLREFLAAEGLKAAGPQAVATWLSTWMSTVKEAKEGKPSVEPARWGEVYGLFCGLVDDPLTHLRQLRAALHDLPGSDIFSRALSSADGLSPAQAIDFIFEDTAWKEDDVLALVGDTSDRIGMEAALMAHVRQGAATRTLAIVWNALETMGRTPVRRDFFDRCGRWPEDGPPVMEACPIPAGRFLMGSPEGQGHPPERPQHEVIISTPFLLGRTPVSVGAFKSFEGGQPGPGRYVKGEADDWPVVNVSWYEARLFAAWVGGRLPSEAEWEYACRGRTSTPWWPGNSEADLKAVGWFDKTSGGKRRPSGKPPTKRGLEHPFKLHDMHGNVLEWCDDGQREYESKTETDPRGPNDRGSDRVFRGGSFWDDAFWCRSANRLRVDPGDRGDYLGFRVALPAPQVGG